MSLLLYGEKQFPVFVDLLSQYAAGGISTVLTMGDFGFISDKNFPVAVDLLSHLVP